MPKRRYCERYDEENDKYEYCEYNTADMTYEGECICIYCKAGLSSRYCDGGKGFCTLSDDTLKKLVSYRDLEYSCANSYDDICEFESYRELERKKEENPDKWTAEDEAKLKERQNVWEEARAKSKAFWDSKFDKFFKENDKSGIIRKLLKRERV